MNALVLGLETLKDLAALTRVFGRINKALLALFTLEIALRLAVFGRKFFTDRQERGWNIFDFLVVGVGIFADEYVILRSLRVLRVLRILSILPSMCLVVDAVLRTLPSMFSIAMLLFVLYYIYGVLCVNLFGSDFPELFGTLGRSFYTLFQIMTFESWSSDVVRPVMRIYPYAWVLFVSYIFMVSFVALNLIVTVIVNSLEEIKKNK